jgi:hypothetical protein
MLSWARGIGRGTIVPRIFGSGRASALCVPALCAVAIAFTAGHAAAQPASAPPPARDFKTYQPTLKATRVTAAEAPKIDGDLSDAVWAKAEATDEFYQLEPAQGQPGSERTVLRVLYDESNIYVSVYCYDRDPSGIKATIKARDGAVSKDDVIRIYFDPHMTRRDGYGFEINPLGGRLDELIQNNNTWLPEWNTIWDARARIVSDGWTVEFALPFRSLSFDTARSDWGFDFLRVVRRKNERIRWSSIDNSRPSVDISHSGTLTGITGTQQGMGLEIKAFTSRTRRSTSARSTPRVSACSSRRRATSFFRTPRSSSSAARRFPTTSMAAHFFHAISA